MKTDDFEGRRNWIRGGIEVYSDPVCGMEAVGTEFEFVWEERTFHLCSASCLETFRKNPGDFWKAEGP